MLCAGLILLFAALLAPAQQLPRVWMSYSPVGTIDEDFRDLKDHGVDAISVPRTDFEPGDYLSAARKYGIRLIIRVEVPTVSSFEGAEPAVLIGGAYQGKAIDRFRFAFSPTAQNIVIDAPFYHRDEVYGSYGRYYDGLTAPLRGEVIVKGGEAEAKPRLRILPAKMSPAGKRRWRMQFDLTGVEGDLERVALAVYWQQGLGRGKFRDNPSAFAASTHAALSAETKKVIDQWTRANGGSFPSDVVFAMRFGDECFHFSAHTATAKDVSYPLFDYSESAIRAWRAEHPDIEYPRGAAWTDLFSRQAYANWLYDYHRACARLVKTVKRAAAEAGAPEILVFRNTTRADVFAVSNDRDGSGQQLLAEAFDILHLDPYPVQARRYGDQIPNDMSYMAGLGRRFNKPVVPWMQAHEFYPEGYFGLVHPTPDQVRRMMAEHMVHGPAAVMWLGYSKRNTFPNGRRDSWDEAAKVHAEFRRARPARPKAALAALRPYTVRALRDEDRSVPLDHFFTSTVLRHALIRRGLAYDSFEPLDTEHLRVEELRRYPLILAEMGELDRDSLSPVVSAGVPAVLFIEGADRTNADLALLGARRFIHSVSADGLRTNSASLTLEAADLYQLAPGAEVLASADGKPFAWRFKHVTVIAVRGRENDGSFGSWLSGVIGDLLP